MLINAAFLYEQLLNIDKIITKRKILWYIYKNNLDSIINDNIGYLSDEIELCLSNYHIFYIVFNDSKKRLNLQKFLKNNFIQTFTHYLIGITCLMT